MPTIYGLRPARRRILPIAAWRGCGISGRSCRSKAAPAFRGRMDRRSPRQSATRWPYWQCDRHALRTVGGGPHRMRPGGTGVRAMPGGEATRTMAGRRGPDARRLAHAAESHSPRPGGGLVHRSAMRAIARRLPNRAAAHVAGVRAALPPSRHGPGPHASTRRGGTAALPRRGLPAMSIPDPHLRPLACASFRRQARRDAGASYHLFSRRPTGDRSTLII